MIFSCISKLKKTTVPQIIFGKVMKYFCQKEVLNFTPDRSRRSWQEDFEQMMTTNADTGALKKLFHIIN